jgi:NADH:ubiquinone reductase (H+-translocating)
MLVGGGPTGLELAGSIAELARALHRSAEYRRVILLKAGPHLLAGFYEKSIAYAETALECLHVPRAR